MATGYFGFFFSADILGGKNSAEFLNIFGRIFFVPNIIRLKFSVSVGIGKFPEGAIRPEKNPLKALLGAASPFNKARLLSASGEGAGGVAGCDSVCGAGLCV